VTSEILAPKNIISILYTLQADTDIDKGEIVELEAIKYSHPTNSGIDRGQGHSLEDNYYV